MPIEERVKGLPLRTLMSTNASWFAEFEKQRKDNAGAQMLPCAFILRLTLEYALFLDLFPFTSSCGTFLCKRAVVILSRRMHVPKFSMLLLTALET